MFTLKKSIEENIGSKLDVIILMNVEWKQASGLNILIEPYLTMSVSG